MSKKMAFHPSVYRITPTAAKQDKSENTPY